MPTSSQDHQSWPSGHQNSVDASSQHSRATPPVAEDEADPSLDDLSGDQLRDAVLSERTKLLAAKDSTPDLQRPDELGATVQGMTPKPNDFDASTVDGNISDSLNTSAPDGHKTFKDRTATSVSMLDGTAGQLKDTGNIAKGSKAGDILSVIKAKIVRNSSGRRTSAVFNTSGPHTDPDIWNTQGGKHPVDEFWADRFIIDPQDPDSGPIKRESQESTPKELVNNSHATNKSSEKHFSLAGLEGAWLP